MIEVVDVVFETGDLFFGVCYLFLYVLDTLDRFLQALQVIDLAPDPHNYLSVWVVQFLRQPIHHGIILVGGMSQHTRLLVVVSVEIDACALVLTQSIEKGFCTQMNNQGRRSPYVSSTQTIKIAYSSFYSLMLFAIAASQIRPYDPVSF